MQYEFIIANKRTGQIFDLTPITSEVTITTNRTGQPGTLKFTLFKAGGLDYLEGDTVRFSVDGQLQFYGFVMTKVKDRWGNIETTCYDRLRYLKANASYLFVGSTADEIIRQIAADYQIGISEIESTGYKIPTYSAEDQPVIDIMCGAIEETLVNTGKIYVLYDDGVGLCLKQPTSMRMDVILGDKSYVGDYSYKTDIDEQTYNSIKLVRPNEETGRMDVFIAQDSANIGKWGLLQLYQQVDGAVNDAQMEAQAKQMLAYYNQRMRTLKVSSLGVPGVRAGMMVYMKIQGLGDINLDQYVLLEKVTHTYTQNMHTMELETMEI